MQQLFYLTNDGRLKDPRSSTEYEAHAWPGRIVALCPRQPDEALDEFRYLAIVELLALPIDLPGLTSTFKTHLWLNPSAEQSVAPLSVQRKSRPRFQCLRTPYRRGN